MIVNLAPSKSALLHELTHALLADDFPDAAVWLAEGLATLHEAGVQPHDDGGGRPSAPTWRRRIFLEELAADRLRSLAELLEQPTFRGPDEARDYAHAQHFCEFLRQRGKLDEIYRRYRDRRTEDPTGRQAILAGFPNTTWLALERQFCQWAETLR